MREARVAALAPEREGSPEWTLAAQFVVGARNRRHLALAIAKHAAAAAAKGEAAGVAAGMAKAAEILDNINPGEWPSALMREIAAEVIGTVKEAILAASPGGTNEVP